MCRRGIIRLCAHHVTIKFQLIVCIIRWAGIEIIPQRIFSKQKKRCCCFLRFQRGVCNKVLYWKIINKVFRAFRCVVQKNKAARAVIGVENLMRSQFFQHGITVSAVIAVRCALAGDNGNIDKIGYIGAQIVGSFKHGRNRLDLLMRVGKRIIGEEGIVGRNGESRAFDLIEVGINIFCNLLDAGLQIPLCNVACCNDGNQKCDEENQDKYPKRTLKILLCFLRRLYTSSGFFIIFLLLQYICGLRHGSQPCLFSYCCLSC